MEMGNNGNKKYILAVATPLAFQGVQTKFRDTAMKKKYYLKRNFIYLVLIETLSEVIRGVAGKEPGSKTQSTQKRLGIHV